ncbi:MAG: response regulator transcription factor [Acidobacteria bacterium]|nr:response regulator transcription factor [Acidobacteriota bacterium]
MSLRILLVEDEPGLVLTLTDLLSADGYEVQSALNGRTGLERAQAERFDLIILDVMLPEKSGLEVCSELRQNGCDSLILMLTAKARLSDRVNGLKIGADDYLTKPFEPPELLARIQALLRRVRKGELAPVVRYSYGAVEIDFDKGEATKNGAPIVLAGKELELLRYLVTHRGKVVSRDELLEGVWKYQPGVSSRTVDVHVAWLRHKLEDSPQAPVNIQTVRGVGYRFVP